MNRLGLNVVASQEIYKDFISGKIINKYDFADGRLMPSAKFSALVGDIETYRSLYTLLGFDLIAIGTEAYYISRTDRMDLNETGAAIQVILLMLCRGLISKGISPRILLDSESGISAKDVDSIGEDEEVSRILKATNLQTPLTKTVNSALVDKGIMHKAQNDRYILSCAGKCLYDKLFTAIPDNHS